MTFSMQAFLDDFGKVVVEVKKNFYNGKSNWFTLSAGKKFYAELQILEREEHSSMVRYVLQAPANLDFGTEYYLRESHGLCVPLEFRFIVHTDKFNKMFYYPGNDLGSTYHLGYTDFALWAPTACEVSLHVYRQGVRDVYPMPRSEYGVYRTRVMGNLKHALYLYEVHRNGEVVLSLDPYGYSSSGNSLYSAVIDPAELLAIEDPGVSHPVCGTDAILYEMNVRDMTSNSFTGTRGHRTFSALCEENTYFGSLPTGLNHITSLGVTHVQLQPVMDFATVDEFHSEKSYNWGYDPVQYLTPEGSYSSDPDDPYARMWELRQLVCMFHKYDLQVTLDLVFNHFYNAEASPLGRTVPYYYFRYTSNGYLSNGTFCGNDVDSTQLMTRKYLVYVCERLMDIYCVDGFRFDLMGILDIDTVNAIREAVTKKKPYAMVYGEGWDMPTALASDQKAIIANASKMPHVGFFNDYFRDIIKGGTGDGQKYNRGYATGDLGLSFQTLSALNGNVLGNPYTKRLVTADQSINALETHDNATLWDKMHACCANEDRVVRKKRQMTMIALTLFGQGVPFLHAGMEFCGTKKNNANSYNAGDGINQMDWERAELYQSVTEYTRKCIALRKKYKAFRLNHMADLQKYLRLTVGDGGIVFYDMLYPDEETHTAAVRVVANPSGNDQSYHFPEPWQIVLDAEGNSHGEMTPDVRVPAYSVVVCVR